MEKNATRISFLSVPFPLTEKQIYAKIANGLTLKGGIEHINECEQLKRGSETHISLH